MPADEVLRPGRDGATVDLVFEPGGGSWPAAALLVLRALVVLPATGVVALPVGVIVVVVAVIIGATFAAAATVCALLWLSGALVLWVLFAVAELRSVRRVQFAPARAPTELRFVLGARTGAWAPISDLRHVRLDESVEEPYEGDPAPAARTLAITVVTSTGGEGPHSAPKGTDADALHRSLEDLLGPAGVRVVRRTERRVRRKPPVPSGGWVYGGSGSANSGGGFSGGG
ncbi:hypothetical protein ACIPYS_02745 [Kitasatospora sp. NPDC089913]|uniref:hypothetical protein n=1 Tax=Kitasatospora sp. NPDC089913 TaxID=3364080 RepID=UPI0037F572CF